MGVKPQRNIEGTAEVVTNSRRCTQLVEVGAAQYLWVCLCISVFYDIVQILFVDRHSDLAVSLSGEKPYTAKGLCVLHPVFDTVYSSTGHFYLDRTLY